MQSETPQGTEHDAAELSHDRSAAGDVYEYLLDAIERTVLFWDVLRQRANGYYEHRAKKVPHVLSFDAELVLDGRALDHPVNYLLVRIKPPAVAYPVVPG